jgi:hypothetical protein
MTLTAAPKGSNRSFADLSSDLVGFVLHIYIRDETCRRCWTTCITDQALHCRLSHYQPWPLTLSPHIHSCFEFLPSHHQTKSNPVVSRHSRTTLGSMYEEQHGLRWSIERSWMCGRYLVLQPRLNGMDHGNQITEHDIVRLPFSMPSALRTTTHWLDSKPSAWIIVLSMEEL